jgi:hypothetical protein
MLAMLHCHISLRCGCCDNWPVMLCITPRLWKITMSPSVHRCAYMVEGEYAHCCKLRHILLTFARSVVVVTSPVAGFRVSSACTQHPAICRLGSPVSRLRQTIYDDLVSDNRCQTTKGTYWEGMHFLSLEGWKIALCFLTASGHYAQAIVCSFAVLDPFIGSRGVMHRGVQCKFLFFFAEQLKVPRPGED